MTAPPQRPPLRTPGWHGTAWARPPVEGWEEKTPGHGDPAAPQRALHLLPIPGAAAVPTLLLGGHP